MFYCIFLYKMFARFIFMCTFATATEKKQSKEYFVKTIIFSSNQ